MFYCTTTYQICHKFFKVKHFRSTVTSKSTHYFLSFCNPVGQYSVSVENCNTQESEVSFETAFLGDLEDGSMKCILGVLGASRKNITMLSRLEQTIMLTFGIMKNS